MQRCNKNFSSLSATIACNLAVPQPGQIFPFPWLVALGLSLHPTPIEPQVEHARKPYSLCRCKVPALQIGQVDPFPFPTVLPPVLLKQLSTEHRIPYKGRNYAQILFFYFEGNQKRHLSIRNVVFGLKFTQLGTIASHSLSSRLSALLTESHAHDRDSLYHVLQIGQVRVARFNQLASSGTLEATSAGVCRFSKKTSVEGEFHAFLSHLP